VVPEEVAVAVQLQHHDAIPTTVFDALPFPAWIVDDDMKLVAVNRASVRLLGEESDVVLRQRGGEFLHCVNSADGCGKSTRCPDCVLRGAARFAVAGSQPTRQRAKLEVVDRDAVKEMYALITASPVVYEGASRVLLCIENLTALLATTDALPICMHCKKVRDNDLWLQIEGYLDSHLDLKFSHGICPDCAKQLYPGEETLV
jgi:PAS domain-containing protein